MWRLTSCERCGGDLFFCEELFVKYWLCLQCGFHQGEQAIYNRELALLIIGKRSKLKEVST